MLDKTVPFAKLKMVRRAGTPILDYPLPDGFKYTFFKDGNEADWARIETSVDEFDSEFAALLRFKNDFMPYVDELYRRCLFIEAENGEMVATANAWWSFVDDERRAWLHWVSVAPGYQGLGLGKAIVSRVTQLLLEIEGDVDFFLSTQTWSYKAINIYKQFGYEPTDEKILYPKKYKRHYKKALKILKKLEAKSYCNV
ncbi:MAG: GNAT family N-acetyltransferase [Oscillospiraceae bacterium]|jgi:GNAT superfamily N-acetyltransferase|nr:GNAT family N-acetyltransferase [Oscillospiraceae bacterium]